ncbi:hypothetical protein R3P38DRAFT_3245223 [Favolaschia claudopus]|uniref:Uncharacterized protein n=1 Tax=Favolaschia claudopus TaxID=2862362 RepID=A0AAV9Z0X4_9AGAR
MTCEKRDGAKTDTDRAAVEELKQCTDCGLVFKHLTSSPCKRCVSRNERSAKPSKDKENRAAVAQQSRTVIDLDSDTDDIQEIEANDTAAFKIGLQQNKKNSSTLRLTPKLKEETLSRTAAFLVKSEASRKRPDSSKAAQILFKVNLCLQKSTGQKRLAHVYHPNRGVSRSMM